MKSGHLGTEGPQSEAVSGAMELTSLSRVGFRRFADYITRELGIKMPESKMTLVQSRLMRRVRELRMRSIEEYQAYFFDSGHTAEREHVINAITTNKTDFFREAGHLEYLRKTALTALLASERRAGEARLKLWSAGCSTGEEPYSIAMVLADFAESRPGFDFAILATDISTRVLRHARQGIYKRSLITPIPREFRSRYLLANRDGTEPMVRIVPALRSKVSFHQLNFMKTEYRIEGVFDVVFCRNVLIYFDAATREAVIRKICGNLRPGGYLFTGHSESLSNLDVPVRQLGTSIYAKTTSK